MRTLFVGNLPFSSTSTEITNLFSQHGTVNSVNLIYHRETGRPKGFCFVEMDEEGAEKALKALNGVEFGGRALKVETRKRDTSPKSEDGPEA
ncbi:MAG: RNA-binding protein [Deltaproteobacteria bacterium]|nr:RNA-binding protein [Deltaproteobacteria bacterium]